MVTSAKRSEGREMTGERSPVCVLAGDKCGFNPSQLFPYPHTDTLTHTQSNAVHIRMNA